MQDTGPNLKNLIQLALDEDIGPGDITSAATIPAERRASGIFIARETLVLAGTDVLRELYEDIAVDRNDGDELKDGEIIARVTGPARRLLELERTALNFLQQLSGIATETRKYARAVEGTNCKVLDTRKTTPGHRLLEKAAVKAGGGTNHRTGLFDAYLIKNNHITAAGGIRAALAATGPEAEIEVRTLEELDEALACGAKHLLLDNLTPADAKAWIDRIAGRAKIEVSGGITLENVRAYAETGADFVSSGAITHSARAVDISFRIQL